MMQLNFDYSKASPFIEEYELNNMAPYIQLAHQQLHDRKGPGQEYTDWLTWPEDYDRAEFARIHKAADKIKQDSEVLVVIGIGGSYLGARAAIDFLCNSLYSLKSGEKGRPLILFAGNNISPIYINDIMDIIGDRDFSINVISKSGTTTEPSIAFRIFKAKIIEKYGEIEANRRIYVTTDQSRGALKAMADEKGYESFVIPDGIGGRFTVLTAVGLLPIAVAGGDIDELMMGAREAMDKFSVPELNQNLAYQYAAIRNILYRKGKEIEILVNYEPNLQYFAEWWKQLFGESEGKDQKGIFPVSANFSTDLHSIGQIIQDGRRNLFETVIKIENVTKDLVIPAGDSDSDGLSYIEGQSLHYVNTKAFEGTLLAHTDGGVPNLIISIPQMDAKSLGFLIYFFEKAVAISGYLNGVNPFDQPGVEAYKKNMFALLGKPGFEDLAQTLNSRL